MRRMRRMRRSRRGTVSYVPLILGIVGVLAMLALVDDRNVRTWAIVIGCTTVAAVGYAAYQEQRANRAVAIARRRSADVPYDELRREMDRARRHERPFALARIRMPRAATPSKAVDLPETFRRMAWRSTDRAWRRGRDLYLLLPETTADATTAMLRRTLDVTASDGIEFRVAAFPESGVTVGALFRTLGASAPRSDDVQIDSPAPSIDEELELMPVPARNTRR